MARLQKGENEKIDRINDLVAIVKDDNSIDIDKKNAMEELLLMFRPLIIKTCDKWSNYFNDPTHRLKPFDELLADGEYWFIWYTTNKYTIDGDATYNKFIKDHLNQRIRYIYECQIKYYNSIIFPDPDKNNDDSVDPFETVVYNYSSNISGSIAMEDDVIESITLDTRMMVAHRIMDIVSGSNRFNDREKKIFIEIMCNGVTQDEMSKRLGISRTRVVQILRKIKCKLKSELENDNNFWGLITQTDIDFDNNYL